MIARMFNMSFVEMCDGTFIHHNCTSINGAIWNYTRQYMSASGARTKTEVLDTNAMIGQLKLLSHGVGITTNTDVLLSHTTLSTTSSKTKTAVDGIVMILETDRNDKRIDIYDNRENSFTIFVNGIEKVIGRNAEELFRALGEIC